MPNLSEITGSKDLIGMLVEHVVEPILKDADNASKRVIIYGPPGTGKTFIAKALAGELDLGFKFLCPRDQPKDLINAAKYASRQSLIYFDELEWVNYRPVYMEALMRMPKDVLVIGGTNYPWKVQGLKEDVFTSWVFMAEPDLDSRRGILEHNLGIASEKMDLDRLAELTGGYTSSDIHHLCEWVGVLGQLTGERLEDAIGNFKTVQISEWIVEAKANADRLDRTTFEPFFRWLENK
jgi:transitional endoplasmic reticulum ATPase